MSELAAHDSMLLALLGADHLQSFSWPWQVLLTDLVAVFYVFSIGLDAYQVLKGLLNNELRAARLRYDPPFVQCTALAYQVLRVFEGQRQQSCIAAMHRHMLQLSQLNHGVEAVGGSAVPEPVARNIAVLCRGFEDEAVGLDVDGLTPCPCPMSPK
jgi:hypothetical protein